MSQILVTFYDLSTGLFYPAIFLCLLLITVILFWRKTFARLLLLVTLVLFYFSSNGIIPKLLIEQLEQDQTTINEQSITAHQAMIVLGGGISEHPTEITPTFFSYARVLEAFRIYHIAQLQDVQYTIFLSGGDTLQRGKSEAELFKTLLMQMGIPEQYLVTENNSLNTFQNAQYMQAILNDYNINTVVLVTSGIHMKRATEYFNHFNINTLAAPSDFPYPVVTLLPSAYNLALLQMAIHEYWGILALSVYNALGLN